MPSISEAWHKVKPTCISISQNEASCACQGRETAAEKRYRKLLLSGLELNKDFYFSYTYNLARTLQANLTADAPADPFDSMFVWNEYLGRCVTLSSWPLKASNLGTNVHAYYTAHVSNINYVDKRVNHFCVVTAATQKSSLLLPCLSMLSSC